MWRVFNRRNIYYTGQIIFVNIKSEKAKKKKAFF